MRPSSVRRSRPTLRLLRLPHAKAAVIPSTARAVRIPSGNSWFSTFTTSAPRSREGPVSAPTTITPRSKDAKAHEGPRPRDVRVPVVAAGPCGAASLAQDPLVVFARFGHRHGPCPARDGRFTYPRGSWARRSASADSKLSNNPRSDAAVGECLTRRRDLSDWERVLHAELHQPASPCGRGRTPTRGPHPRPRGQSRPQVAELTARNLRVPCPQSPSHWRKPRKAMRTNPSLQGSVGDVAHVGTTSTGQALGSIIARPLPITANGGSRIWADASNTTHRCIPPPPPPSVQSHGGRPRRLQRGGALDQPAGRYQRGPMPARPECA